MQKILKALDDCRTFDEFIRQVHEIGIKGNPLTNLMYLRELWYSKVDVAFIS